MYNPNLPPSPSDKNINEIQTNLDPMKRAVKEIIKNGTNPFEIGGGLDKKLIVCQEMISSGELIITYSDPEKNGEQELNSETDSGALHTALEVIKNGGFSNVKFELINKVVSHLLKVMKNTDNFDLEKSGFDPENPNVKEAFYRFKAKEKRVISKRAETVIGIFLDKNEPLKIADHTKNLYEEQKRIFQSELFMHLTSVVINSYQNGTPIDISVVVWSGSETKVLTAIDLLNDFRTNAILNSIVSGEKQILSIIPAKKETVSQAPQQPQPSPEAQKSDLDNFLAEAMRNPNQISNLNLNELINYFSRLNPAQNPREIQSLNSNYDKLADLRIPRSDGGFTTGKLLATDPQDYKLVVFKDKDGKYAFKIL
jgi:hypothetical protein